MQTALDRDVMCNMEDVSRICVTGDSAGGHPAAKMGISAGHSEWVLPRSFRVYFKKNLWRKNAKDNTLSGYLRFPV